MADGPNKPNNDETLLSAYTDRALSDEEREDAERMINSDPRWRDSLRLDEEIDASLRRLYAPPPSSAGVAAPVEIAAEQEAAGDRERWRTVALLAVAASIAWLVFAGQLVRDRGGDIAFVARPLDEVYRECVDDGFEPYWICDDDAQFAATFDRRQGVALRLAPLPEGARMRGLAYLAGLSRDSTSMLAEVDGEPVIVFVDRAENDWGPATGESDDGRVRVWRSERLGLVFYEVSPLDEPRITPFLEPADATPNG